VLVKQGQGWLLQDQGSGNGTLVNGEKVGEHPLADGDTFVIGDTEIQFSIQGVTGAVPQRRATGQVPARRAPSSAGMRAPPPRAGRMPATGDTTGELALAPGAYDDLSKKKKTKTLLAVVGGLVVVLGIGEYAVHAKQQATAQAAQQQAQAEHDAM